MGGVLVLGLYTVPVLGFVIYKILGVLGMLALLIGMAYSPLTKIYSLNHNVAVNYIMGCRKPA